MTALKLFFVTSAGKFITWFSRTFNFGHGSTWPGHLALKFVPDILSLYVQQLKKGVVLVAGTNGKTTTVKMTKTVLEKKGYTVIHNESGANLLNGLVSSFLLSSNWLGNIKADYAIFEVDEATLPLVINKLSHFSSLSFRPSPKGERRNLSQQTCFEKDPSTSLGMTIVLLNLFRDQLDRYGEVDTIARKWKESLSKLDKNSTVILNADDPQIAVLGKDLNAKTLYFGINDKSKFITKKEHATDSVYCLSCGSKLIYTGVYYSHLGVWSCAKCGFSRPKPTLSFWEQPLAGLYNLYNTLAAVLICQTLAITKEDITSGLKNFQPAFGRQEEFDISGKKVKVFLAKNPVGVNEAIRTITGEKKDHHNYSSNEVRSSRSSTSNSKIVVVLALNDNIPDGRDVSWIWDVEYEELVSKCKIIICTGLRAYDLGLRIKYAMENQNSNIKNQNYNSKIKNSIYIVEPELAKAIEAGLKDLTSDEILYILPTYSAMLNIRKILSGKKIL